MHVLFIHSATESLGVEYLSAVLKSGGHQVSLLFDPQLYQSFRLFVPGSNNNVSLLAKMAVRLSPDMICFSVGSDYFGWALQIAELIKRSISVPVIFGGIHPTVVPEVVLANEAVDYVCLGEGETALLELANSLQNKEGNRSIENIWFRKNGVVHRTPLRALERDLDRLPFPDKDLFFRCFPAFVTGAYMIISGRGCVNACSYCYNSALRDIYEGKGAYYRRRSVGNVISELENGVKRYRFRRVSFCDDVFTADVRWLKEFSTAYARRIGLPYYCAVYPPHVDEERVSLLVKSGCSVVNMGIQTIDSQIRKECLCRKETTREIVDALSLFSKTGIFLYTNFIFGLPGQGEGELEKIALFCSRHRADFHDVNWLRYYPGTGMIGIARGKGLLNEAEVTAINAGMEFKPYAHGGHGFSNDAAKIRNFIFFAHFLPEGLVEAIVRRKIYRAFPSMNMRNILIVIRVLLKKCFEGKRHPYPNFSIYDSIYYYVRFIFNKPVISSGKKI